MKKGISFAEAENSIKNIHSKMKLSVVSLNDISIALKGVSLPAPDLKEVSCKITSALKSII